MQVWSLAAVLLTLLLAGPVAAEPVFARGGAVGLEPPPGLRPAERFAGFENAAGASILLIELPPTAYYEMERGLQGPELKRTGMTAVTRRRLTLKDGPALLIRGRQTVQGKAFRKWVLLLGARPATAMVTVQAPAGSEKALPDKAVEAALLSVVVRTPADDERLRALPFRIADVAGLRVLGVLGGSAVALTEGPEDEMKDAAQPLVIVASGLGPAPPAADRIFFARKAAEALSGVVELKLKGEPAAEGDVVRLQATGKDADTGRALQVVQVIRFEADGYLRTVGVARADAPGFGDRVARVAASLARR